VGRTLTLYPREQYEAQVEARQRQETDGFKTLYGKRAGIESTIAQGMKITGLRNARYIGLARTRLQHIAIAVALNWVRLYYWFIGERPEEKKPSPFLAVATQL
jgi:transposase